MVQTAQPTKAQLNSNMVPSSAPKSFLDLPGEIRNRIYHMVADHAAKRRCAFLLEGAYALPHVSRQLRAEFRPIYLVKIGILVRMEKEPFMRFFATFPELVSGPGWCLRYGTCGDRCKRIKELVKVNHPEQLVTYVKVLSVKCQGCSRED